MLRREYCFPEWIFNKLDEFESKDDSDPIDWGRLFDVNLMRTIFNESDKSESETDPVNHPSHYNAYGLESLEAIEGSMSREEYLGFLKGNALKYLYRYRLKGKSVEDLSKAAFYIERMKPLCK